MKLVNWRTRRWTFGRSPEAISYLSGWELYEWTEGQWRVVVGQEGFLLYLYQGRVLRVRLGATAHPEFARKAMHK